MARTLARSKDEISASRAKTFSLMIFSSDSDQGCSRCGTGMRTKRLECPEGARVGSVFEEMAA